MTLEICIQDVAGLDAAVAAGADRVELCSALSLGGLSPAPSLIAAAAAISMPAHMLVRPREGSFVYTAREAAMLADDIGAAASAGLAGIVIGASLADRTLDTALLATLVAHAQALAKGRERPLSLTLHRAFDLCPDLPTALETAIALGFDHILTSGGEPRAPEGVAMLARLHRQAAGRITILAGSGITAENVGPVLATGVRDIHASCSIGTTVGETLERRFGFVGATTRHTDAATIRNLRTAIDQGLIAAVNTA